jgi:predicted MFS family arabinose efflux permease
MGVGGFIGTILISSLLKKNFYGTLVVIPLLMAVIAVSLIAFGSSISISLALLGVWGLVATAAPVGWWSWLARTLPENAEAGGGLMVAVVQLAIGLGSTVGGLLFDMSGYQNTFVASAALLLISAFLAFLTSRAERTQKFVNSI